MKDRVINKYIIKLNQIIMWSILLVTLFCSVSNILSVEDIYIPQTTGGKYCKIPFVYRGTTYHDCADPGTEKSWCYIDGDESNWDYCKPHPDAFKGCRVGNPNVTVEEVELILREHNKVRARMSTSRMRKMVWNTELAIKAQAAADRCIGLHMEGELCAGRILTGQNLYTSYNTPEYPADMSWEEVVGKWSGEEKNFDIKTLGCAEGKLCGHFTQVVWDRSGFVGCGKAYCHGELFNRKGNVQYSILYFCNYFDPGNYVGSPPYRLADSNKCEDCWKLDINVPKQRYRCDKDELCEACFNDQKGCQSLEDIKKAENGNKDCEDVSPLCEVNKNMCVSYKNNKLPKVLHKYVFDCKLTCGLC